jgi:hypothetical protein
MNHAERAQEFPDGWSTDAEYAIGRGIIINQDVALLENSALAQSNLLLNLILPLGLFVFAAAYRYGVTSRVGWFIGLCTAAAALILFIAGMYLRGRYVRQLQSLIIGKWEKTQIMHPMTGPNTSQRESEDDDT